MEKIVTSVNSSWIFYSDDTREKATKKKLLKLFETVSGELLFYNRMATELKGEFDILYEKISKMEYHNGDMNFISLEKRLDYEAENEWYEATSNKIDYAFDIYNKYFVKANKYEEIAEQINIAIKSF